MKRKTFIIISILIILVVLVLSLLSNQEFTVLMNIIVKPMAILGEGLRNLSLSGTFGNLLAWVIYLLISLLPLFLLGIFYHKYHTFHHEDILLLILSIVLFISIYYMINPHKLSLMTYWSLSPFIMMLIIAYVALKFLKMANQAHKRKLAKYCSYLLFLIVVSFLFTSAYLLIYCSIKSIGNIQNDMNTIASSLDMTKAIIIIQYMIQALPYFLGAVITNQLIILLSFFQKNPYASDIVSLLQHITHLSCQSIALMVILQVIIQGICVIAGNYITINNAQFFIPLTPLLFVLAVLLMSKIIYENIQLKKDNELFI